MTSIRCLTLSLLTCAALALLAPGAAVATEVWSDFNGDGFADLAIGVPDEDVGNVLDAGAVNVLYGTAAGLSADGNQLWHQDSPGILYAAEKGDRFGRALAAGDFDGDGFADLAVGADYEDIGNVLAAGVVHVLYGTAAGLSADGNQLWHQDSPGMLNGAGVGDLFGYALAAGDFDGDGIADLAIGVLLEDVNAGFDGAVSVLYGTAGRGGWPGGLSSYGNQLWHQDSYGILGVAEAWDLFGFTLAAGDFDGDGFADLAVGAPLEGIGSAYEGGAVNVLYGTAIGLSPDGNQLWHQDSYGILGVAEESDHFGWSLAAGDFDGDGFADLAIGAPLEHIGSTYEAGAVNVLYGSAVGLSAAGNQLWHQDSPGILDAAQDFDEFGGSLAAGDFDGDGFADLAIGVPSESMISNSDAAGAVNVLYGSALGLSAAGNQLWHQDTPGIPGVAGYYDYFGLVLVAGDFDGDGFADLAVGVPDKNSAAGVVHVLHGYAGVGLSSYGNQLWHQDSPGIQGVAEQGDRFGSALGVGATGPIW